MIFVFYKEATKTVHRVDYYVAHQLPHDFEADDLRRFMERKPLSGAERGVFEFCLHSWDRTAQPFELSQIVRWDEEHLKAFADWASGSLTGPCHYF